MTSTTLKVKNGIIRLPAAAKKSWRNADAFIRISPDTVVVKKTKPATFWNTWRAARRVFKGLSERDVQRAIVAVRRRA